MESIDAKVYYDASGVGGSTYSLLSGVGEVSIGDERTVADVKYRGEDRVRKEIGMIDGDVTIQLRYQPSDTGYQAVKSAFDGRTDIGLAFLDAPIGSGVVGVEGDYKIATMTKSQPVDDTWWVDVTCVVSADADAILPRTYTSA